MSVGALIEFYFKLIICIAIPEEPTALNLHDPIAITLLESISVIRSKSRLAYNSIKIDKYWRI
ncbi:hypothetical protein [Microcystis aeruginosa]